MCLYMCMKVYPRGGRQVMMMRLMLTGYADAT